MLKNTPDPLGPFSFTLFEKTYTVHPRENLEVHVSTLGEALQTNSTWFAFYAALRDEAQNTVDALAAKLQQRAGQLYVSWQADPPFKITEVSVKENTRADEEYINIQEAIVDSNLVRDKLNSFTKAFEDRRFCIVALAARSNNSAFHDTDATPRIRSMDSTTIPKGIGKHPSQKG